MAIGYRVVVVCRVAGNQSGLRLAARASEATDLRSLGSERVTGPASYPPPISATRHTAFASRICWTVVQEMSRSAGRNDDRKAPGPRERDVQPVPAEEELEAPGGLLAARGRHRVDRRPRPPDPGSGRPCRCGRLRGAAPRGSDLGIERGRSREVLEREVMLLALCVPVAPPGQLGDDARCGSQPPRPRLAVARVLDRGPAQPGAASPVPMIDRFSHPGADSSRPS